MAHLPKEDRNISVSLRVSPRLLTAIDDYIAAEHARHGWKLHRSQIYAKALSQFLNVPLQE